MRTEPPYVHGTPLKTAVVLVNLGTPDAPSPSALRVYLKQFLSDPRVVEIPRLLWWLILHGFVLRFRPKKSAAKYKMIWTPEGSPLLSTTKKQAAALDEHLKNKGFDITVVMAMRYGNPSLPKVLDQLRSQYHDRLLIVPLFPQYAAATVGSVFDAVAHWMKPVRNLPELRFVKHFHDDAVYIQALADSVNAHWARAGRLNFAAGDRLMLSFHGVPQGTLLQGDPYHCECHKTARLLARALDLLEDQYIVTFQSRFGRAAWLQPYTDKTLQKLAQQGTRRIDIMCPGFVADCLETLEEIAIEGQHIFRNAGGLVFYYIPCLNDAPAFTKVLARVVECHTAGWPVLVGDNEIVRQTMMTSRERALRLGTHV